MLVLSQQSKKGKRGESLSCLFLDDVSCSFRGSKESRMMARCPKCSHYERFLREMDEEEEEDGRLMDEKYRESKTDGWKG